MQIQPETIIWDKAPPANVGSGQKSDGRSVFRLERQSGERINGSMPVWGPPKTAAEEIAADLLQATGRAADSAKTPRFATALNESPDAAKPGFGFLDFVDMVNPLQHIPVVGTIYRNLTGDEIRPVSRVVGGAAFGGPFGAMAGIVNAVVQMGTGKDVADNMMASDEAKPYSTQNDTTIAVARLGQPRYNS